jgi:protein-tyrosine phosphatase
MNVTIESLYSEILPNLFISGTLDEDVVQRGKSIYSLAQPAPFDSVVCLYGHANPIGYYVREQRFGIADAELDEESKPEIRQLADWLHSEWKSGKRVAGKCQAGWNRSSLVVALVLLNEGYSAHDAINLIREKRSPNALCNQHFVSFINEVYESEFNKSALIA